MREAPATPHFTKPEPICESSAMAIARNAVGASALACPLEFAFSEQDFRR